MNVLALTIDINKNQLKFSSNFLLFQVDIIINSWRKYLLIE